MLAKIILVRPEFDGNLGFTARAMKNFGLKELLLVQPIADKNSGTAKARAMHAMDLLKKARTFKNLDKALKKVDYSIATTSKISRNSKIFRTALSVKEFAEKFSNSDKFFGIVFGPEKDGLSNQEIKKCDFIVHIPAHHSYPELNLSHSAIILFYELFQRKQSHSFKQMNGEKKKLLEKQFFQLLKENLKIKNPENVKTSVKAFLSRGLLSEKEANALISLLKN